MTEEKKTKGKVEEKKVVEKPKKEAKKVEKKETKPMKEEDHIASVFVSDLAISTKQSVEVCNFLRNRRLEQAKSLLNEVIAKKRAVPFKRYNRDTGHKPGIAAGRYPIKTCKEILRLLDSVEANAENKALDTKNLVLFDIRANQGPGQWHYGRKRRRKMKRTHIIIQVKELEK